MLDQRKLKMIVKHKTEAISRKTFLPALRFGRQAKSESQGRRGAKKKQKAEGKRQKSKSINTNFTNFSN